LMSMKAHHLYVAVVLPLPVDQAFTYAVPEEFADQAVPGVRVLVPFGRKKLTGVIVEDALQPDDDLRIRPLFEVLDDEPALTPELLKLTRWISSYYLCGWGEAVRAALPPGTDVRSRTIIHRGKLPAEVPPRYAAI